MKKIIVILSFCLLGVSLTAQEKVVIIPFTGGSGDEGNAIAQILKAEFTELGNFQIASHTEAIDKVLEDKNIQKTGLANGDTVAKLGKGANADYVISGHIQTFGRKKIVLASIMHIKTFKQLAGDYYEYRKFEEVINYLPTLASKLISKTKTDFLNLPSLVILPFHGTVKEKATGVKGFFSKLSSSKADEDNADILIQLLAIEIANSGKYAVISRERTIENIMEEQTIKISNLADVKTATKLGKEINAQYILSGNVSPIGNGNNLMNVAIIEVLSLAQEAGAYVRYKTIEAGARLMPVLSSELTGVFSETTLSSEITLSLKDAIALYEGDEAKRFGDKIVETIKKLIVKDINAKNPDDHNYTPLIYASEYGYTEIVKSLIAEGADIDAQNDGGNTALIKAAWAGDTEVVKVLLAGGANLETKDDDGRTALMNAAWYGRVEAVTVLIAGGADLETKDDGHMTALMRAAWSGRTEIVTVLIEAGANLDVKTDDGKTALYYASDRGHTEITNLLKAPKSGEYKIGDTGPGGGIVFYKKGDKYLECSDNQGTANWKSAHTLAKNYRGGGYADWYLPSKTELNYIYKNLRVKNLITDDGFFWSSTERDSSYAWGHSFFSGSPGFTYKTYDKDIRVVRAF